MIDSKEKRMRWLKNGEKSANRRINPLHTRRVSTTIMVTSIKVVVITERAVIESRKRAVRRILNKNLVLVMQRSNIMQNCSIEFK